MYSAGLRRALFTVPRHASFNARRFSSNLPKSTLPAAALPSTKLIESKCPSNIENDIFSGRTSPQADRIKKFLYGPGFIESSVSTATKELADKNEFEVKSSTLNLPKVVKEERRVKIGTIQNQIVADTSESVSDQRDAIHKRVQTLIKAAGNEGVNVLCLQEAWTMPFAFCTREKYPWVEFAESAETGPTTTMLSPIAKRLNMVIISPILERDQKGIFWNTAVIISNDGEMLGKHRKNHIPRVNDFNESTYYMEGNTGHPVFETDFGKLAVNICYGRHHPLNWMAFGLNGAEIVFNPSATVDGLSESLWPIEARNAAIANGYFTVSTNRVGTETFPREFTSGDKKEAHKDFGHFYGSSYITSPDGSRTMGLSRDMDGLLIADVDLNVCQQMKDTWVFQMTARYEMYRDFLIEYCKEKFMPQIINKSTNNDRRSN